MTDYDDIDDLADDAEEQKKKKKKGSGEIDSQGIAVGEGFYAKMVSIGAPASLIASVLKNWSHLRGEGLRRALADFARRITSRATAHVEVEIAKDKDYGLIHNILQYFKSIATGPDQRQRLDNNRFDPK